MSDAVDEQSRSIGWDESTRPIVTPAGDGSPQGMGQHLVLIHDMFRRELDAICQVRDQVRAGTLDISALRQQIHDLAYRYDPICQPEAPACADHQRDDRGRFIRRAA